MSSMSLSMYHIMVYMHIFYKVSHLILLHKFSITHLTKKKKRGKRSGGMAQAECRVPA
jgi:hypothetical protein